MAEEENNQQGTEELFTDVTLGSDDTTVYIDEETGEIKSAEDQEDQSTDQGSQNPQSSQGQEQNDQELIDPDKIPGPEEEGEEESEESESSDDLNKEVEDFKEGGDTEDTQDQDTEDTTDTTEGTPEDEDTSASYVSSLASALREEGVLSDNTLVDEEGNTKEPQSAEELLDAVNKEVENKVEDYKNSVSEDFKDLIEAREAGVPVEEYKASKSRQEWFSQIDEDTVNSDEDLQKQIVKKDLANRGYSEERINRQLESLEDSNKLQEEANDSLKSLQDQEKQYQEKLKKDAEEKKQEEEKKRKEQIDKIKEDINNTDKILPDVELTDKEKQELLDSITNVRYDDNGQPVNKVIEKQKQDPVEFEKRLHYLAMKGFFDKDADMTKMTKKQRSKAMKELKEKLNTPGDQKAGKPKSSKGKKSKGNEGGSSGSNEPGGLADSINIPNAF